MRRLVALLLLAACQPLEGTLCAPCVEGGCGDGMACVDGTCLPRERDGDAQVPRYQVCGLSPPPPGCGEGPPCADGRECFEGACRPPVQIAAGWHHACVRWASGRVSCWGGNRPGVGGDPLAWTARPRDVAGITDAVDLAASIGSTCVLRATGEVVCWGENDHGQLGRFTSEDLARRFQDDATPAPVSGLAGAERLGSAIRTTCAVAGGALWCWGAGNDCLLGDERPEPSPVPLPLSAPAPFERLAGGDGHLVGVARGRAYGWGSDADGRLAGHPGCRPADLGVDDVVDVAAGSAHTCVLTGDGVVRCLGRDDAGQALAGAPVPLPGPAVEVRAAFDFSCARLHTGDVACWGRNEAAVRGRPEAEGPVDVVPGTTGATTFAVGGGGFGCFVRDDGTWCWGHAANGETGAGRAARRPTRVAAGPFEQVDVGPFHVCALGRDGRPTCFGDNREGQLGRGARTRFEGPGEAAGRFAAVAVEAGRTCALDDEGAVWCWGGGAVEAARVAGLPPARALTSGWNATCALTRDGEVWCFGANDGGLAAPGSRDAYVALPRPVPGLAEVEEVVAGGTAACARVRGGAVRCWGEGHPDGPVARYERGERVAAAVQHTCVTLEGAVLCAGNNQYGQLGDGTARAAPSPVRVLGIDDAVEVATDFFHTCVLSADGAVRCFGQDLHEGRLGVGERDDSPRPVRVDVPPLGALSVGRASSCGLDAEGALLCWGWDGAGLATGTPPYVAHPVRVEGLGRFP